MTFLQRIVSFLDNGRIRIAVVYFGKKIAIPLDLTTIFEVVMIPKLLLCNGVIPTDDVLWQPKSSFT
jgi:hypothetical protein